MDAAERRPACSSSIHRHQVQCTTPTRRRSSATPTAWRWCSRILRRLAEPTRAHRGDGVSIGGGIIVLLLAADGEPVAAVHHDDGRAPRFRTVPNRTSTSSAGSTSDSSSPQVLPYVSSWTTTINLPISSHVQNIQPVGNDTEAGAEPEDLKELKQSLEGTDPAGFLVLLQDPRPG